MPDLIACSVVFHLNPEEGESETLGVWLVGPNAWQLLRNRVDIPRAKDWLAPGRSSTIQEVGNQWSLCLTQGF